MQVWPGSAYPLGATWDGSGTNFALFSEVAERVELCLFDESGAELRVSLTEVAPDQGGRRHQVTINRRVPIGRRARRINRDQASKEPRDRVASLLAQANPFRTTYTPGVG